VAKDSSRIIDGEIQRLVDSWGQKVYKKNKKKNQTTPKSPHVVWEGFKKNLPRSSKNKLQQIHDRNFKRDRVLWSDETKNK